MLERTLSVLESHEEVIAVFTNFVRFRQDGALLSEQFPFYRELPEVSTRPADAFGARIVTTPAFDTFVRFGDIPAFTQAMTFRADAIADLFFDEDLTLGEDTHFCLRAFQRGRRGVHSRGAGRGQAARWQCHRPLESISGQARRATEDRYLRTSMTASRRALRRRIGREWVNMGRSRIADGHFGAGLRAYGRGFRLGFRRAALLRAAIAPLQIVRSAVLRMIR